MTYIEEDPDSPYIDGDLAKYKRVSEKALEALKEKDSQTVDAHLSKLGHLDEELDK